MNFLLILKNNLLRIFAAFEGKETAKDSDIMEINEAKISSKVGQYEEIKMRQDYAEFEFIFYCSNDKEKTDLDFGNCLFFVSYNYFQPNI